mgnify:FL=1
MWKTDSDLTVGHFRGTSVAAEAAVHFEHPKQSAFSSDTFTEIVADGDMCATHAVRNNTNVQDGVRNSTYSRSSQNDHTLLLDWTLEFLIRKSVK